MLKNLIFTEWNLKYRIDGSDPEYYYFDYKFNKHLPRKNTHKDIIHLINDGWFKPIKWLKGHTICKTCNPFTVK